MASIEMKGGKEKEKEMFEYYIISIFILKAPTAMGTSKWAHHFLEFLNEHISVLSQPLLKLKKLQVYYLVP